MYDLRIEGEYHAEVEALRKIALTETSMCCQTLANIPNVERYIAVLESVYEQYTGCKLGEEDATDMADET